MVVEKPGSWRCAAGYVGGWRLWIAGHLVDWCGLRSLGVGANREKFTCAVENLGRLGLRREAGGDRSDGVKDGRVIAVELASYLGE